MSNPFDDMRQAVRHAEEVMISADRFADSIARMIIGRLRKVSPLVLEKLKKELRDFNAHTHKWKD